MNISLKNKEFLNICKTLKKGDIVENLKVIDIFTKPTTYEERINPNVLYRKKFQEGILFKKLKGNTFIFVPNTLL